eukprot:Skav206980  [mRNA]  locus=scaffold1394:59081:65493:- [translate_table: standard]
MHVDCHNSRREVFIAWGKENWGNGIVLQDSERVSCSSRPTSSVIATTALQDIPGRYVSRAISFLGERDQLPQWLADKTTKLALWRQGVDEPDVLAATSEVRYLGGEESRHSPHTRYATQLLAQIAWEVDLLDEDAQVACAPRASETSTVKPPLIVGDVGAGSGRPCSKASQTKRPTSAGRVSEKVERENIILERWEQKLAFAFHLKAQHKKEVEIKAREQNSKIQAVREMHAKLLKENKELQYHRWQGRTKDHDDKIARSKCAKRERKRTGEEEEEEGKSGEEKKEEREAKSRGKEEEERKRQRNLCIKANAEKKRQDVRNERRDGKPRLRAARELSRKQALRLESNLAAQDGPPLRPSSARPPMLSRPSRPAGRPVSRPTSAQPRMEPKGSAPSVPLVPSVPDPACIPLPRCVRRYSRPNPFGSKLCTEKGQSQSKADGPPETQQGCRSAPAGIAVACGEVNGHNQTTIDPLGIFPIGGLGHVSDTTLESDTLGAAACFSDLVCWAWEDDSTEGATFLTEMDCDKVETPSLGCKNFQHESEHVATVGAVPDVEVRDAQEATLESPVVEAEESEEQVFCTCGAAPSDPLSTARSLPAESQRAEPSEEQVFRTRVAAPFDPMARSLSTKSQAEGTCEEQVFHTCGAAPSDPLSMARSLSTKSQGAETAEEQVFPTCGAAPSDPLSTARSQSTKSQGAETSEEQIFRTCDAAPSDPLSTVRSLSTKSRGAETAEEQVFRTCDAAPSDPLSTARSQSTKSQGAETAEGQVFRTCDAAPSDPLSMARSLHESQEETYERPESARLTTSSDTTSSSS